MLTEEQIDQFHRDGFTVSPSFLKENTVSELLREADRVTAGSTIAKDVSANALGVTRTSQKELPEWSKRTREKKLALKAKGEKG